MKLIDFFDNYLSENAKITLVDTHGNIFYSGNLGDCTGDKWKETDLEKVEGLGSQDDIIITCFRY